MKIDWTATTVKNDGWEVSEGSNLFRPDVEEVENQVVNLYPEITFQTFEGFGGALTDASGYVYSLMNPEQKKEVVETYFSPERMGYNRVRMTTMFIGIDVDVGVVVIGIAAFLFLRNRKKVRTN